jgi:hypothetical protein
LKLENQTLQEYETLLAFYNITRKVFDNVQQIIDVGSDQATKWEKHFYLSQEFFLPRNTQNLHSKVKTYMTNV